MHTLKKALAYTLTLAMVLAFIPAFVPGAAAVNTAAELLTALTTGGRLLHPSRLLTPLH